MVDVAFCLLRESAKARARLGLQLAGFFPYSLTT